MKNDFMKDRDLALLSLDKKKIIEFMDKYEIKHSANNPIVFWAGVHKAIIQLNSASKEQKYNSRYWLFSNGFKDTINL